MSAGLFSLRGRVVVVTGGLGQLGRQFTAALTGAGARRRRARPARRGDDGTPTRTAVATCKPMSPIAGRSSVRWRGSKRTGGCRTSSSTTPRSTRRPMPRPRRTGRSRLSAWTSWDRVHGRQRHRACSSAARSSAAAMADAGRGSIVNIARSTVWSRPTSVSTSIRRRPGETFFKPVAYSASKSALLNLTRYLATYWAARGVRVNTLTFAGVFNDQERDSSRATPARCRSGAWRAPTSTTAPSSFSCPMRRPT